MSSSSVCDRGADVRAALELLAGAEGAAAEIDEDAVRALLTVAVRLYAARADHAGNFAGVAPRSISATEALMTASTVLRAVKIAPFELGLWEAWS